jgi:hypothetical protein
MIGGAAALALALVGCERDPAAGGAARVSLLLTDAPGDVESAEVQIREVYLQGGDGGDGGRVVLYSGGGTFDLMELRDGVTTELAEATVPAGSYRQLRIVIGEATLTTGDGTTYSTADGTLHCPSCEASGLKVKLPRGEMRLEAGEQIVLLDFDVAQSFGSLRGQSGRWVMHPVINGMRMEGLGSIDGTVSLADGVALPTCGGAQVTLAAFVPTITAGEVSLSGTTDASGDLRIHFVAPETYTTGFASEVVFGNGDRLTLSATPSVATVVVGAGSTETVDYTITAAGCEVAPPAG